MSLGLPDVTAEELRRWCDLAHPGQLAEYYRGWFVVDRDTVALKRVVSECWTSGWYDLVQRRHGLSDYSYMIQRRRRRDIGYREGQKTADSDLQSLRPRPRVTHLPLPHEAGVE